MKNGLYVSGWEWRRGESSERDSRSDSCSLSLLPNGVQGIPGKLINPLIRIKNKTSFVNYACHLHCGCKVQIAYIEVEYDNFKVKKV